MQGLQNVTPILPMRPLYISGSQPVSHNPLRGCRAFLEGGCEALLEMA